MNSNHTLNDQLYIVVPAYNEAENIERFVDNWYPIIARHSAEGMSRLVIVCDGCTDNTYEILQQLTDRHPLLVPLTKENGGHGSTVLYGYRYALEHGASYIFQTDSDGQTDPAEFEEFWEQRDDYEAIFGNRMNRGDGQGRVFVEFVLRTLLMLYYGVVVPDANAPFRLMRAQYVADYLPMMPEDYELPNAMLAMFGVYYHRKVQFLPISFRPRQGGVNSINHKAIIGIGLRALHDFRQIKKGMK